MASEEGSGGAIADDAAWRPPPLPSATSTEELAGYADLVEVGRGGDSVVYRARQLSLGRDVAVKVLGIDAAADPARTARFAREIEFTVDLGRQHPNIVTLLDVGTTASGRPAIVMDYFDGGTLHDRLRAHGPMPTEEVVRVGEVLADALAFAHGRGVLHRDVKPQNVLVLPTSWVLADFGIARAVDAEHTASAETFTYRHASPQLLDGLPPTTADDLWSLGSTLFTLLDGRPPFASGDPDDDSALSYLRRARTEPPRTLEVPGAERLAAVIGRCLTKDVEGRWRSAAELRDALHQLRGSAWEPGGSPPAPRPAVPAASAAPAAPVPVVPIASPVSPAPVPPRPPVEPAPVAVSAVSHVAHAADAAPTGTGYPDPTGRPPGIVEDGRTRRPEVEPEEPGRRRRLPYVLAVAALAIGLAIGVLASVLRGGDGPTPTDTPPVGGTADDVAAIDRLPDDVGELRRRASPGLATTITDFRYLAGQLRMSWTDPSDGEAEFVLMRVGADNTRGEPFARFAPGETSFDGTLPTPLPLGTSCYYLLVLKTTGEFGVSDRSRRCPTIRP